MKKKKGTQAYGEVRNKTLVPGSSPERLIQMLFEKACVLLRRSLNSLSEGETEDFQKSCLHALQIVLSLRFVLKTEDGDELSKSLFDTYTAIAASLFKAKEERDPVALSKIYEALSELREAWSQLLVSDD